MLEQRQRCYSTQTVLSSRITLTSHVLSPPLKVQATGWCKGGPVPSCGWVDHSHWKEEEIHGGWQTQSGRPGKDDIRAAEGLTLTPTVDVGVLCWHEPLLLADHNHPSCRMCMESWGPWRVWKPLTTWWWTPRWRNGTGPSKEKLGSMEVWTHDGTSAEDYLPLSSTMSRKLFGESSSMQHSCLLEEGN